MSDVDVIVLDLDGGAMLDTCVESILDQTEPPSKVIVLDNGSSVPVAERLRRFAPGGVPSSHPSSVVVIRSETNLGFAAGVNRAVEESDAPFVALVNNDVVLDRDWIATLRGAFTERDAALQTVIRRDVATVDGAGIDVGDGTFRQVGHGARLDAALPPAWGVSATAAIFRRDLLRFDVRFFAYYEDVELCARLHESGWATRVVPLVKAMHRGSASAPRLGGRALYLRTRNRYLVARLHPGTGRIGALFAEDLKLLARGRSSPRGMIAGLFAPLHDARDDR